MEKLEKRFDTCGRALDTLFRIGEEPFSIIVRDAAIQRFEYTFETVWKLLKACLLEYAGIVCNAPKDCFRQAQAVGWISEEEAETFMVMTDYRNLSSHTYVEEVADRIFGRLKGFSQAMEVLFRRLVDLAEQPHRDK